MAQAQAVEADPITRRRRNHLTFFRWAFQSFEAVKPIRKMIHCFAAFETPQVDDSHSPRPVGILVSLKAPPTDRGRGKVHIEREKMHLDHRSEDRAALWKMTMRVPAFVHKTESDYEVSDSNFNHSRSLMLVCVNMYIFTLRFLQVIFVLSKYPLRLLCKTQYWVVK